MKFKVKDLYYVLLFLAFIPSGSICGFPVKDIIIIILMGYGISKKTLIFKRPTRILVISALMMLPWGILSLKNGYEDGMVSFLKNFLPFFLMMIVTYIYIDNDWIDFKRALQSLKSAAFVLMGAKIVTEILLIFHIIDYSLVFFVFENILDTVWIPFEGALKIYRITTPNDALPLIVIGLSIISEKEALSLKNYLMILLGFFFVTITFSRVLILEYTVIIVIAFMIYFNENRNTRGIISFLCLIIFLICGLLYVSSSENILELLKLRFSSNITTASDSIRKVQYKYLMNGFLENVAIGNGLGAYVRNCIRSYSSVHSYELEWLALFYQLGILGVMLIIGSLVYSLYLSIFKNLKNRGIRLYLGVLFLIWLIKPLYNPNMFSSHSAVILGLMIFISYVYGEKSTCVDSQEYRYSKWRGRTSV